MLTSVQDVPFHDSVFARFPGDEAVLVPVPANEDLPVFKSLTSVHEVPFHDSVFAMSGVPPKTMVAVVDPLLLPANCFLAVFKSPVSVHAVPL